MKKWNATVLKGHRGLQALALLQTNTQRALGRCRQGEAECRRGNKAFSYTPVKVEEVLPAPVAFFLFVCLFAPLKLQLLREVTNKLVKKGGGKKNAFLPFPAPPSLILNKRTTDSMLFLWTRLQYFQGQFLFFSVAKTSVTHRESVTPSRKLFLCSVLFKYDHMQRSNNLTTLTEAVWRSGWKRNVNLKDWRLFLLWKHTPIPVMARSQVMLLWAWRHESMAL